MSEHFADRSAWILQAQELLRRARMVLNRAQCVGTAVEAERRALVKEIKRFPPPPGKPDPDWIDKLHSSHGEGR